MSNQLSRPLPTTFSPEPGVLVDYQGKPQQIISAISVGLVLVEDELTQERHQANVADLKPWAGPAITPRRKTPDLSTIPEEKITEGLRRQEAVEALLKLKMRTRQDVKNFAEQLGLSVSHLYALLKRYQDETNWSCLVPHIEIGKPHAKRLPALAEQIIEEAIDQLYLSRAKAPMAEVIRECTRRCKSAGLKPPAANTVKSRILARDAQNVLASRRGKKEGRDKYAPMLGAYDEPRWPLQRVQIDHTVADLFVVDEETRLPITRPILTVVIDEFSRMVLGFHLSLYAPSTLSVALALTQAILPKQNFLKSHCIQTPWDAQGLPDMVFTDNATEFDSRGIVRGCAQYGIQARFRPLGAPHFGGRVERLLGSLAGRVRLMPGATMRSVAERGDGYDPEQYAALTLAEAETRIAMELLEVYHRTEHRAIGTTPLKLYEFGILGDDKTPGRGLPRMPSAPQRLLLDFLPVQTRTIQTYGIQIGFLRYHSPVLRGFQLGANKGKQFVVRYDPRDLSRVFLYSPEDGQYYEIPRANAHFPPVALWEVKAAIKHLKDQGHDPDNELAIQQAIDRMRKMDEEAIHASKRARRNHELRRLDRQARPSALPTPAAVTPAESDKPSPPKRRIRPIDDVEAW